MSFVAVAIGGAAIIGAGASIIAGNKASKAQTNASNASTKLQEEQNAEAKREFDLERGDLGPYREAGYGALSQLAKGTQPGAEFNRSFTAADFHTDPGYDWRLGEGQRAVEAGASARGGVLSGGALKALTRYAQGFASNEYENAYNRFNTDLTTRFNRLSGIAGTGQTAVNSGNAAAQNYIDSRQVGVNNISNNLAASANARASSYVNAGNAIGSAAGQIGNYFALRDLYKAPAVSAGG